MAKKGAPKSPMKSIARVQSKQAASLSNIGAVLQQHTEALQAMQAGQQAAAAPAQQGIGNQQVIASLNKIAMLLGDGNEYGKKMVANSNKQIDAIWKANKDWKGFGDKFKDFTMKMKDNLNPDTMKKAFFGNFSMFKGARNKVEDIDFKKQMRALGDTRSNKELNAAAKDSRGKKETLLKAEDQIRKIKATGVSDEDLKKNRPDLLKARQDALKSYQDSRMATRATAQGKPETPRGNFTGDQPSAPLNKNTPKGNFSGDQPSAPLALLPSDKGQVAQSTTDLAAEMQQKSEMERERTKMIQLQTDLLQQIASNTAGLSGKKGSSAGGPEDVKGGGGGGMFGGLLDGIGGIMGEGLMGTFRSMFSPGNLLKALGKTIAIGALIGAVFSGITDGWKEYQKTGSISQALIAGLAGIVDFLTFGLFDKEKIKDTIGSMAKWMDDHMIKPITGFFTQIKNDFMEGVSKIGIPKIQIHEGFPKLGIDPFSVGPWYPFKGMAPSKTGKDGGGKGGGGAAGRGAGGIPAAVKEAGKGGPSDSENDKSAQDNGFVIDKEGNVRVVDQAKYKRYQEEQGMSKAQKVGQKWDAQQDKKMRAQGASMATGAVVAQVSQQQAAQDKAAMLNAVKSSGGGSTVVQQNNNNNTTVQGRGWGRPRNEESAVSEYIKSRFGV